MNKLDTLIAYLFAIQAFAETCILPYDVPKFIYEYWQKAESLIPTENVDFHALYDLLTRQVG